MVGNHMHMVVKIAFFTRRGRNITRLCCTLSSQVLPVHQLKACSSWFMEPVPFMLALLVLRTLRSRKAATTATWQEDQKLVAREKYWVGIQDHCGIDMSSSDESAQFLYSYRALHPHKLRTSLTYDVGHSTNTNHGNSFVVRSCAAAPNVFAGTM